MTRVVCTFSTGPEVVVWDHGRKNMDNAMISDMFLYLLMLNFLDKESYTLYAIPL